MKKRISRRSIHFFTVLLVIALAVLSFGITVSANGTCPDPSPSPAATPLPSPAATPSASPAATPPPAGDIVEIAIADGRFTTLVTAVQEAGLVDTLKGPGPFTVFAPTDEAFNKLPPGTLDSLLANTDQLEQVLLYHVVQGEYAAQDILNTTTLDTVQGAPVDIGLMINDAKVIVPDVMASNGVIHVIDTVLIPPAAEASPLPSPTPTP